MSDIIQLVKFDPISGDLSVTTEAMNYLSQLPSNIKIAPIALIGPIANGKSFLANSLLNQNPNSFSQGNKQINTVSNTNGIQISTKLIEINKDLSILLMDTQGLPIPTSTISVGGLRSPRGSQNTTSTTSSLRSPRSSGIVNISSNNKTPNTDKLLQLITLLSQTTIFNIQGSVSDRLLDYLEPIARLHDSLIKDVKIKEDDEFDLDFCSNQLTCVIRDHIQIDLKTSSSYTPTSPLQMLESCFKKASSVAIKKQKLQESLRQVYKVRDCVTLPKPTGLKSEESFEPLTQLTQADFQSEAQKFLEVLKSKAQAKTIKGKQINGNMFLGLIIEYIQILQAQPKDQQSLYQQLVNTIDRVASEETERQQEFAYSNFEQWISNNKFNYPNKDLELICRKQINIHKATLRMNLADILPFDQIIQETSQFETRAIQLIKFLLDENYSVGYQLSVDVLNKLCNQSQAQQMTIKEKWNQIIQDYSLLETENMFQVFAQSILKSNGQQSQHLNDFVEFQRIQPKEIAQSLNQSEEDTIASIDQKQILLEELPQIMDLLQQDIEKNQSINQATLNNIQYQTQVSYNQNTELEQKKIQYQIETDNINSVIQQINLEKNDYTLQIESIQRQIQQEQQSLQDLSELKLMQDAKQNGQQELQLQEFDALINKLQDKIEQLNLQSVSIEEEINKEGSMLNIEAKKYEGEIQILKEDIEAIELRLISSDKSIMFKTTQEFLQHELPQKYLSKIKECFEESQFKESKDLKLKLFQKHRDLNQLKMKITEQESEAHKLRDEALNKLRQENQLKLDQLQEQYNLKVKQSQASHQLKEELQQKLTETIQDLIAQKENNQNIIEDLENADMKAIKSLNNLIENRQNLVFKTETMMQLEEDSYELTILNQAKVQIKEKLIEVLPEIVNAAQRQPKQQNPALKDNLLRAIRMIDDDHLRSKLTQILRKYKIIV